MEVPTATLGGIPGGWSTCLGEEKILRDASCKATLDLAGHRETSIREGRDGRLLALSLGSGNWLDPFHPLVTCFKTLSFLSSALEGGMFVEHWPLVVSGAPSSQLGLLVGGLWTTTWLQIPTECVGGTGPGVFYFRFYKLVYFRGNVRLGFLTCLHSSKCHFLVKIPEASINPF